MTRPAPPALRAPFKQLLDDRLPELQVQQIWRKLENSPARTPRRVPLPAQLLAAGAATILFVATGAWLYTHSRPSALAIVGSGELTPQRMLGGARASSYRFSDGSAIRLGATARLEVVANDGRAFALRLESGHARFDVNPGGPRRWEIDCGELDVEVVGTSFAIERAAAGVAVRVQRGVVRVRGARVPNGEQRLTAGERLFVARARPAPPALEPAAPLSAAGPVPAAELPALDLQPMAAKAPATDATEAPSTQLVPPQRSTAELAKLLRRADRAQRQERRAEAESLLPQVRAAAAGSTHAALAALTLARLRLESAPALAAADLDAALAGPLPATLREDALASKVEAHARAGDRAGARAAADAYARAFPGGRRAADVERWLGTP